MSFFKKAALSSAAVLAALSLSACSKSSSSSSSTADKKASLTLWVDTEQVPYYKDIVKDFHKKYPNITVKVTQSPNGSANAKTDVRMLPKQPTSLKFQTTN